MPEQSQPKYVLTKLDRLVGEINSKLPKDGRLPTRSSDTRAIVERYVHGEHNDDISRRYAECAFTLLQTRGGQLQPALQKHDIPPGVSVHELFQVVAVQIVTQLEGGQPLSVQDIHIATDKPVEQLQRRAWDKTAPVVPEVSRDDRKKPKVMYGDRWRDAALCAGMATIGYDPWFGEGESTRKAKQICKECPVKDECLNYALESDEGFGVWGGLTERERQKLKRRSRN